MMEEIELQKVNVVSVKVVKEKTIKYGRDAVTSPKDVVVVTEKLLKGSDREKFVVVCLDAKCKPTAVNVVSIGSLTASIVHPREVFKVAILSNAHSVVAIHNHPSGDPSPSNEDKAITNRLVDAGKLLGIPLMDHIVVGDNGRYLSLKEEGLIRA